MKKLHKTRGFLGILLGVLLISGMLIKLGMNSQQVHQGQGVNQQKNTVRYVLVNEDKGAKYQNKTLNLGNNFVNLINQDQQHSWQVAALNVAEAGFNNGTYDVEIILPQNFSQRLLNLESMNPQKAQITYKVKRGASERTNRLVQAKVGTILNSFNQKIIKMYFSSVLANLTEAQRNVTGIASGEQVTQTALTSQIQTPFKALPESFSSVITTAQDLAKQNTTWQKEQADFTKQTQSRLTINSQAINASRQDLAKYIILQTKISELNQKHATALVAKQSTSDTKIYKNFYDQYDDVRTVNFNQLVSQDESGQSTGLLAEMGQVGATFSQSQQKRMINLQAQIEQLIQEKARLVQLKTATEQRYFNGKVPGQAPINKTDIRESVKQLLTPIPGPSNLPADYLNRSAIIEQTNQLDAQLPVLIQKLHANRLISDTEFTQLMAEYSITKRYVEVDLGESMNKQPSKLIWLTTTNENQPVNATTSLSNTFKIATNQNGIVSLVTKNGQQVKLAPTTAQLNALNKQLSGYHGFAKIAGDQIKIEFKTPSDTTTTTPSVEAITLQFKSDVIWTFSKTDQQSAYRILNYQLNYDDGNASNQQSQNGTLSSFVNSYREATALQTDFGKITDNFTTLANISQRLVMVFGSKSDKTLTTTDFDAWLQRQKTTVKLSDLAADDSIYNKYDYIDEDTIADYYVDQYSQQGHAVWKDVTQLISNLDAVLTNPDGSSLTDTLASMTDTPELLNQQQQKLASWYDKSNQALATAYQQWQANPQLPTTSQQYTEGNHDDLSELYFDQATGETLGHAFQSLSDNALAEVKNTEASAAKVTDLTDQFKTLVKATSTTNEHADKVFKNTNELVNTVTKKTSDNKQYANDFNHILNNTHTGGADNQNVFNFLANPLTQKGVYQETSQTTSAIPYLMTVLMIIVTLLLAISYARQTTPQNSLRLLGYLSITSLLISLAIAGTSFSASGAVSRNSWLVYLLLTNLISVLSISLVWRLLPKMTAYLLGILIGLYLMLTPILGVNIQHNSFLFWLFKISPLQNIENGYTQLLSGPLPIATILMLVLLLLVVALMQLMIILNDRKEVRRDQQTITQ